MLAIALLIGLLAVLSITVGLAPGRSSDDPPATVTVTQTVTGNYRGHSATYWAKQYRARTRQFQHARMAARARWQPTVDYALTLAAAVTGVSYWQLRSVSLCESNHDPYAQNGQYRGLFQMHWSPFGLSPFDPIANALSAAMTVRNDGSWRQWSCAP